MQKIPVRTLADITAKKLKTGKLPTCINCMHWAAKKTRSKNSKNFCLFHKKPLESLEICADVMIPTILTRRCVYGFSEFRTHKKPYYWTFLIILQGYNFSRAKKEKSIKAAKLEELFGEAYPDDSVH